MYSFEEKRWLLSLARDSIFHYLKTEEFLKERKEGLPLSFTEKKGCFVTLTCDEKLRGCIGRILPVQPVFMDVMENAISAAFKDPRFYPLTTDEYNDIEIEISVLSVPQKLEYESIDDLIKKLRPGKDGVIINKGDYSATFLPQVWEQIKNPEDFLAHLCVKCGQMSDEWRKGELDIETYSIESFDEKEFALLLG